MKVINILLLSMIMVVVGCGEKKNTSDRSDNNISFKDIMLQDNKEAVALLSIKYGVDEAVVSNIIKEYIDAHDWMIGFMKTNGKDYKINLNYKKTINDLSSKYSIKIETIAAMLIDYKSICGKEVDNSQAITESDERTD